MEEEEDTGEVDFDLDEFNVEDEVMSDEDEEVDKTVANSKEQSKPSSQPVKLRLNGTPKLSDRWLTEAPKRRRLLKILPPGKEPETEEKQPSSKSSPSVDASTSPEFQVVDECEDADIHQVAAACHPEMLPKSSGVTKAMNGDGHHKIQNGLGNGLVATVPTTSQNHHISRVDSTNEFNEAVDEVLDIEDPMESADAISQLEAEGLGKNFLVSPVKEAKPWENVPKVRGSASSRDRKSSERRGESSRDQHHHSNVESTQPPSSIRRRHGSPEQYHRHPSSMWKRESPADEELKPVKWRRTIGEKSNGERPYPSYQRPTMSDSEAKPIYSTMPTKKIETRPVSGATQISPTYMRATDAQRPTTSRNSDEKEKSLESRCESRNASKTAKPLDPTELKREVKDARPPKATLNGPADLHDSERRSLDGEEKGDVWSNQPETKLNSKKPEANEEVMQYIKGLRNIEYNIKKYTCFYCNPCHSVLPTTSMWEEHIKTLQHIKALIRWKDLREILKLPKIIPARTQKFLDDFDGIVAGADFAVELRSVKTDEVLHFFCLLCNIPVFTPKQLATHLGSFEHSENFLEKCHPDLFLPPNRASKSYRRFTLPIGTTPEEIEREDESRKRFILESVKEMVESKGPGHLQSYQVDEKTVKDPTSEPKATETELFEIEQRLMINSVLDAREKYSIKWNVLGRNQSVANADYDCRKLFNLVGLQYLVEIWAPTAREPPVFFCRICNYLTTDYADHCIALKHISAYLSKDYSSVFDCIASESRSKEEFRRNLGDAAACIADHENHSARVANVLQLQIDRDRETSVAVHAKIAKWMIEQLKMSVVSPLGRVEVNRGGRPTLKGLESLIKSYSPTPTKQEIKSTANSLSLPTRDSNGSKRICPTVQDVKSSRSAKDSRNV